MYIPTNPYPVGPAMQTAQQRLANLEQQYPQYANPQPNYMMSSPQQAQAAMPMLKGRLVSNIEEANAAMIDYDGSLFVFPDRAHGKIYTKQLGLDGNIAFNSYSLDLPPSAQPTAVETPQVTNPAPAVDLSEYAKKSDLEARISELQKVVKGLEQQLKNSKSGRDKE